MAAPTLLLVFSALAWFRLQRSGGLQLPLVLLETAVLLGSAVVAITELLGRFHLLRIAPLSLLWLAAGCGALGFLVWRVPRSGGLRRRLARRFAAWYRVRTHLTGPTLALFAVLAATGIVAWVSPPANYDSMTYQLPRALHWLQQGSTDFYPTTNLRQLSYGPGAVYWQLHLWVLCDGDAAANLVQWFASVGFAVALGLWLRRFFPARAVPFAVLAGLTLPMAVLQAGSTQTDLQVTCWCLIAVVFLTERRRSPGRRALWAGLAFGLAVLTKPNAALVGVPLALTGVLLTARRDGRLTALRQAALMVLAGLPVCLPHFWRNQQTFGSPMGFDGGTLVTQYSPTLFLTNLIRWCALELPSTTAWNALGHGLTTIGAATNAPAITFGGVPFQPAAASIVTRLWLADEDYVAYTSTLILLGLTCLVVRCIGPRRVPVLPRLRPSVRPWLIALALAIALHVLLLKWQVWGNRLLLPVAGLGIPLLFAATQSWRLRRWTRSATLFLVAHTAYLLTFSVNHPLVPLPTAWRYAGDVAPLFSQSRDERFYQGYNAEAAAVAQRVAATTQANGWTNIGLSVGINYPEYVLWRALHDAGLSQVEIHTLNAPPLPHVTVTPFTPQIVITETNHDVAP